MKNLKDFMHSVLLPELYFDALFCAFRLIDNNAFTISAFEVDVRIASYVFGKLHSVQFSLTLFLQGSSTSMRSVPSALLASNNWKIWKILDF